MESPETRFWLRFDSGARQGDRLALEGGVVTIGRNEDNPIVLGHGSVSGRHAEIRIEGGQATLVDLGSTNGTRVGGERITRHRLAHGDRITFGAIRCVFVDGQIEPDAPVTMDEVAESPGEFAPASPAGAAAPSSQELGRVSADQVARSASRSKLGLLLVALVVATAGLLAWRLLSAREREKGGVARAPVAAVPGNLLGDGSFEESEAWAASDAAPQAFFRDGSFARSGDVGLGVVLAEGEWALARSVQLELRERRLVELRAALAPEGGVVARVGLELASSADSAPAFIAWAPGVRDSDRGDSDDEDGWSETVLAFDTLPGYDRAWVVVAARADGEGAAAVDDVSVVLTDDARGPSATHEEYQLFVLGTPGSTAALVRSGRVVLTGIGFGTWGVDGLGGPGGPGGQGAQGGLEGAFDARWSARASDIGLVLVAENAPAPAERRLRILANGKVPRAADGSAWISTVGPPDGYHAHTSSFEREAATDLLLGRGVNLLRVELGAPVPLSGALRRGTLAVDVGPGAPAEIELQLSFDAERVAATRMAERARDAARNGRYGAALAAWKELLDTHPFDAKLIAEAEAEGARIVQAGHERVGEVRRELERADFFQLADLFRQCRDTARETAHDYAGSEAEAEALELVAEAEEALERLSTGRRASEVERLSGVLEALDPDANPLLFAHVSAALRAEDEGAPDDEARE